MERDGQRSLGLTQAAADRCSGTVVAQRLATVIVTQGLVAQRLATVIVTRGLVAQRLATVIVTQGLLLPHRHRYSGTVVAQRLATAIKTRGLLLLSG